MQTKGRQKTPRPTNQMEVSVPYWLAAAPGAYARRDLPARPPSLEAGQEEIERLVTRPWTRRFMSIGFRVSGEPEQVCAEGLYTRYTYAYDHHS